MCAVPAQTAAASRAVRPAVAGIMSTVAGGVGGPGRATSVAVNPFGGCGLAFAGRHLYIGDGSPVGGAGPLREVSPGTGWLTDPAGTGAGSGPLGDGGPAENALLGACGAALDHAGNLVIADQVTARVRVVAHSTGTFYGQAMKAGDIYTVAGTGVRGYAGDAGPATGAELYYPADVQVDKVGNLVISDSGQQSHRWAAGVAALVRVVAERTGTFYGQPMKAGDIYTVAGHHDLYDFAGNGTPAVHSGLGHDLGQVRLDHAGNLLLPLLDNVPSPVTGNHLLNRLVVVAARTGTFYGRPMKAGDIYVVAGTGLPGFSGDGGPAVRAKLWNPQGVTVDGAGNLVVADSSNVRIRVVAARTGTFYGQPMAAGDIYTIAGDGTDGFSGDGGPATAAALQDPLAVAVDGAGNIVMDVLDRVRVVAAHAGTFYGQPMAAGDIYTIAGNGQFLFSGAGGPATRAELFGPEGVATDAAGDIVEGDSSRVRLVPAHNGIFFGRPMTAGHIYTIAGIAGFGPVGDGGPATKAYLDNSSGVALDAAGNVLIADTNHARIRVVAASTGTFYGQHMTAADIYTVAGDGTTGYSGDGGPATRAELDQPSAMALDAAGNALIADAGNDRVRVVAASSGTFYGRPMTAGDIYTVAGDGTFGYSGDGGPATRAELSLPFGVTVDGAGNILTADTFNHRIRVVASSTGTFYGQPMTAGDIYTVAGNGLAGYTGDGGPATAAELKYPHGVAADRAGNLVIADTQNNRIRVVAASTGTFYGQPMTAGDIYTVAGDGTFGYSGDGGPATQAQIAGPPAVAPTDTGNLLIADNQNHRIRMVSG